jgi:hypothetical protein
MKSHGVSRYLSHGHETSLTAPCLTALKGGVRQTTWAVSAARIVSVSRHRETKLYELRPRSDGKGFDLLLDGRFPLGTLWTPDSEFAIAYAESFSQLEKCEVRVFNNTGQLIALVQ